MNNITTKIFRKLSRTVVRVGRKSELQKINITLLLYNFVDFEVRRIVGKRKVVRFCYKTKRLFYFCGNSIFRFFLLNPQLKINNRAHF